MTPPVRLPIPLGRNIEGGAVRNQERVSIRAFVESCSHVFAGELVLDFGCGQQPYRDVVEAAGGTYEGYDRARFPANVSRADVGPDYLRVGYYGAVLCTQVAQYWPDPRARLRGLGALLKPGGHLVITYPTTWPEVEPADLWRYTRRGMARLLSDAGFEVLEERERATISHPGFRLPIGYGTLARWPE